MRKGAIIAAWKKEPDADKRVRFHTYITTIYLQEWCFFGVLQTVAEVMSVAFERNMFLKTQKEQRRLSTARLEEYAMAIIAVWKSLPASEKVSLCDASYQNVSIDSKLRSLSSARQTHVSSIAIQYWNGLATSPPKN